MYANYKGPVKIWPSFLIHNDRNMFYKIIYQKLFIKNFKLYYCQTKQTNLTWLNLT
jgi:hypothetical protein